MRTRALPLVLALAVAIPALDASGATPIWAVTNAAEGGISVVSGSRSGAVVAVVGGGNLLSSKDFGMTWTPVVTGPPGGGSSQTRVAVASPARWFAENGSMVATTTNAGATWQPIAPPPVVRNPRQSFEFADNIAAADGTSTALVGWGGARIVGLCPWAFDFTPVFTTHDGGKRWRRADLPVPGMTWDAEWYDAKRGVIVLTELEWSEPAGDDDSCGSTGRFVATSIWTTSDGGARWKRVLRSPDIWYATASWATRSNLVVIGETNGTGFSYVSNDAGRTFRRPLVVYTTIPADADTKFNGFPALDFGDGKRGWVNTILSGVYRTDNAGTEWTHEPSPSDGGFYGVPDFTALNRDKAVVAGPWTVHTRQGDAPVAPFHGPVLGTPRDLVSTVVDGPLGRTVTLPSSGPLSVRLSVAR